MSKRTLFFCIFDEIVLEKIIILLICSLQSSFALSQTHLTSPLNKAVYQRNNDNVGLVPISFSELFNRYDSIQVSLSDTINNTLATVRLGFSLKENTNKIDTFIVAKGGWYKLKIDYFSKRDLINTEIVEHVGIGEIFIVAGQSNAEIAGPVATDERVIAVSIGHVYKGNPTFISLTENKYEKLVWPSPPGTSFLGVLGDSLVKKLNVPVLFFNAAAGGSNSSEWFNSSQANELPYIKINWIIDRFVRTHGIRGVLWHQGEANSLSYGYNPPKEVYHDEISGIIEKSRSYLNFKKLSWVIAQVSWIKTLTDGPNDPNDFNALEFRTPTREGQKLLSESDDHVFLGPDTDTIEGYQGSDNRPDGVHFSKIGQTLHGQLWNEVLDEKYFSTSQPYSQHFGFDVQIACDSFTWKNGKTYTSPNYSATYPNMESTDISEANLYLNLYYSSSAIDIINSDSSYTWINGETYERSNFTDTYSVTNAAGCDSVITLNLNINRPLATKYEEGKGLFLFPNPVSSRLHFIMNEQLDTSAIFCILAANGKVLETWSSSMQEQTINLSKLVAGNYFLVTKTRKQILVGRFTKIE